MPFHFYIMHGKQAFIGTRCASYSINGVIKLKQNLKTLAKYIAIPLLAGSLSALLTRGGMGQFAALRKPPLSPPGWLFPVVWTALYILMGIASYLVSVSDAEEKSISRALAVYLYQLAVNFLWPVFFFDFGWYLFSFFWLLLLWAMIVLLIRMFYAISKPAAFLLLPYLLWVTFAGYLNFGIWVLNL